MFAFVSSAPASGLRFVASPSICGTRHAKPARAASPARTATVMLDSMDVGAQKSLDDIMQLPLPSGVHMAEYIWIDGQGKLRSKGRTVKSTALKDLPKWNYDGSSTGQAPGEDSEVILVPGAVFRDPFRPGDNVLVMCGMYVPDGTPIPTNTRDSCEKVMTKAASEVPWFGLEQEYFLIRPEDGRPMGFPKDGSDPPVPQGPYYCGVGAGKVVGRQVVEAAWRAQLYAGLEISGINAEVCLGQHEFQCGPCVGIDEGDQMWVARYILERVAEIAGLEVNYEPKPVKGDWNGTGCHSNFSTKAMREEGGYEAAILPAMEKLAAKHAERTCDFLLGFSPPLSTPR